MAPLASMDSLQLDEMGDVKLDSFYDVLVANMHKFAPPGHPSGSSALKRA
jgi:hypothetical protein